MGKIEEFQKYAKEGNLKEMKSLLNGLNDKEKQEMIYAEGLSCNSLGNYFAFRKAAQNGHIDVLKFLLELTPKEKHQEMIHAKDFMSGDKAFKCAAENGHISVLKLLLELTPKENHQEMIHAHEDYAFRKAAKNGYIDILKFLLELTPKENHQEMIHADKDYAFKCAAQNGHIDVLKLLLELTPKENHQEMIHVDKDYVFRSAAAENDDIDVLLLIQFTQKEDQQNSWTVKKKIDVVKFLYISDPFYEWPIQDLDEEIKNKVEKAEKPYLGIDLKALKNITLTSKSIFNTNKMIKFTKNSKFKSIFTPDNEITLKIMEFLSGGTIKQIKSAIPAIQKAYGINAKFIEECDKSFTEKEVETTGDTINNESE